MRRLLRAEIVLPATILCAGIVLGVSEFMTTFELRIDQGPVVEAYSAADRHSYALLMLALVAVGATMMAVGTGVRAFAYAAAGFGVAALLLFLIVDLPDAGKVGSLGADSQFTSTDARVQPQSGFYLEAIGSVVLGLATIAFATLRSEQLQAPLALFGRRRDGDEADEEGDPPRDKEPARRRPEAQAKPKPSRPPRQRSRMRGDDT